MAEAYLCKTLKLTEKQLYETSEEWILHSLILYGVESEIAAKENKQGR